MPGVGEKTAAKLIITYGGLDGIFANLDKQTPKLRESLAANEARVRKNAEVMVLRRDAPIDLDLTNIAALGVKPDLGEVKRLFEFLEFRSLFDRLAEVLDAPIVAVHPSEGQVTAEVIEVDAAGAVAALTDLKGGDDPVSIGPLWVGVVGRSDLLGLAFATGDEAAVWVPSAVLAHDDVPRRAGPAALRRPARRARPPRQGADALAVRDRPRPAEPRARHEHRRLSARPRRVALR